MNKYSHKIEELIKPEFYKIRLKICRQCDSYVKIMKMCKKCGCFMPAKARVKDSDCPINLWSKIE